MVDVDAAEIAKMQTPIHEPVCADAELFLREFIRQRAFLRPVQRPDWLARCKNWQSRYPVVLPEYRDENAGYVNPYFLVDVLAGELNEDDLLTPGSSGPCSDIFMQAFRVKQGQRIVNAPGLGAMGTGLPGSIGACLASGRRTICINGDGGFQLNIQELETVRRLNLPIKFFVLCNGGYASIMSAQRNHFEGRYVGSEPSSRLTLPDITKIAAAYGLPTATIGSHQELRARVREVLDHEGPIVCAVTVSPEQATAPRVTSTVQPDGSIVSKPMEDMWPLLSREEFLENMTAPQLVESCIA
jgi:acetolactate synthase-1/2/3 large subunit